MYPLKNICNHCNRNHRQIIFLSKKQKINEIRYYKDVGTSDAEPGKRYRMHQIAALSDIKRHARTPGSDAFPCTWRSYQRSRISVILPQIEGNLQENGQSCGRKPRGTGVNCPLWNNDVGTIKQRR